MNIIAGLAVADLEQTINALSLNAVFLGAIALIVLVGLAILLSTKHTAAKKPLFIAIVVVIASVTLTIAGSTVYLNVKSATGGPVHWHADFEIWACGNELNLRDPSGLSNKVGTPTLHEHNDKRIHVEGVPVALPQDVSLGKFMQVVGGEISSRSLVVPLTNNPNAYFENGPNQEDGDGNGAPNPQQVLPYIHSDGGNKVATFINGNTCGDKPAEVQTFVYSYNQDTHTYAQTKLTNPSSYGIAQAFDVPPGDCMIIEFAPAASHTNKLCRSYGVKDIIRCESFGVPTTDHSTCIDREVTPTVCAEQAKNPVAGISAECQKIQEAP